MKQFVCPAPSQKATFQSEILELGSCNNLAQHEVCQTFSLKNHSTLYYNYSVSLSIYVSNLSLYSYQYSYDYSLSLSSYISTLSLQSRLHSYSYMYSTVLLYQCISVSTLSLHIILPILLLLIFVSIYCKAVLTQPL